jgi:hypothetical protein
MEMKEFQAAVMCVFLQDCEVSVSLLTYTSFYAILTPYSNTRLALRIDIWKNSAMELNFNPYQHFSERYLMRRLKKTAKILHRISLGKKTKINVEVSRVLMLTISDALVQKKNIAYMNAMLEETPQTENSLN